MKILATAPARVSLAGGGTDLESYSHEFGGRVISMAINLRQHVTIYTDDDLWLIESSLPFGADPKLFYRILKNYDIGSMHNASFVSGFDGFIGAGLGSSAAAAVALIGACRKLQGKSLDPYEVANEAYDTEVNQIGWAGGRQDQFASAFGGINRITFDQTGTTVEPLQMPKDFLSSLVLMYIGGTRQSRIIQQNLEALSPRKKKILDKIKIKTTFMESAFINGNIEAIGNLMHESWMYKRELHKVSNEYIDALYTKGLKNGAWGGKLLGAGQGGHMIFVISPEKREEFIKAMGENFDFGIDKNGLEVRIL